MKMFNEELIFETERLKIRPIKLKDFDGFKKIAFEQSIWKYYKFPPIIDDESLKNFVNSSIIERENKISYSFTIIDKTINQIVGSTKLYNFDKINCSVRIGTWFGIEFQKSYRNRESKFLLLKFIFEVLDLKKVIFTTDMRNEIAKKAIEKIGAVIYDIQEQEIHNNIKRIGIFYQIIQPQWSEFKNTIFKNINNNEKKNNSNSICDTIN